MKTMIGAILALAAAAATASADELSKSDKLHIAVQAICPVSGEKLGEHGTPVRVKIGKEHVFLCCKPCAQGKVNPEHWAKIHANFAKAQGICPIMEQKLPANPKWTIVDGRVFYVCCPPCIEKIEADPKTYLKQLDALYETELKKREVAAAQTPTIR